MHGNAMASNHLHGDDDDANAHMDDLLEEARKHHSGSPKTPLRRPAPEQELPPVVLVEGFFSFFNEVGMFVGTHVQCIDMFAYS